MADVMHDLLRILNGIFAVLGILFAFGLLCLWLDKKAKGSFGISAALKSRNTEKGLRPLRNRRNAQSRSLGCARDDREGTSAPAEPKKRRHERLSPGAVELWAIVSACAKTHEVVSLWPATPASGWPVRDELIKAGILVPVGEDPNKNVFRVTCRIMGLNELAVAEGIDG